jgi:hypothetical protein
VGAFPVQGFARANTTVSVFITDSGYAEGATVYLTQDGNTPKAVANAAIGGAPMEVLVSLTATAFGASSMTLAPCADPGADTDCQKKVPQPSTLSPNT